MRPPVCPPTRRGLACRLPIRLLLSTLFNSLAWGASAAEALTLVPDVREPYRSVLYQIVDGIREATDTRLVQIPATPAARGRPLEANDDRVVIALGSDAVRASMELSPRLPVVTGALVSPTGEPPLPGISLESDPAELFAQLLQLRPGIRRVHWLYRPAQAAAKARGIDLAAHAVDNAGQATKAYQEILEAADSEVDAVWLTQDPALVGDDSNLPDILNRAWTRNVIVFSGALQHVAHGVLFALVPDNLALGKDLARMANAVAAGKKVRFEPNRGLRRAINRRTAEHLGMAPDFGNYDIVLPAR